ncbi:hypothetical protein [Actinoplanes sp. NPDC048796]|uniref:hypothetical protein n=1 Tax=unclassified Actinoplanes TaxID=2626549 RepID=UPI0033F502E7
MKRLTLIQSTLIALPLALLTACGSDSDSSGTTDTAAAPATSSAAPATSPAAPAAPATSSAAAAAPASGDKALCEQANKAKVAFGTSLATAAGASGSYDPAALKKATATFAADLGKIAAGGAGDSAVTKYLKELSAEFGKAAKSADPEKVLDSGAIDKAGEGFDAACAKVGVKAS